MRNSLPQCIRFIDKTRQLVLARLLERLLDGLDLQRSGSVCADKVAATLKVVGLPFTFSFPSVLPGACLCLGHRLARTSLAPRVLPRAQSYPGKLDAISGPKATYPTDPTSPSHSARMAPEEFKHPGVGRLTRQPAAPHRHGAATPGAGQPPCVQSWRS